MYVGDNISYAKDISNVGDSILYTQEIIFHKFADNISYVEDNISNVKEIYDNIQVGDNISYVEDDISNLEYISET